MTPSTRTTRRALVVGALWSVPAIAGTAPAHAAACSNPGTAWVGGRVRRESDQPGQPEDQPVAGATMYLYDGDQLIGQTLTDANGGYVFAFEVCSSRDVFVEIVDYWPLDDYYVQIVGTELCPTRPRSQTLSLSEGEANYTVDVRLALLDTPCP